MNGSASRRSLAFLENSGVDQNSRREPGKTEQRRPVAQLGFNQRQGLRHVVQSLGHRAHLETLNVLRRAQRELHLNAPFFAEVIRLPEGLRHHQDVAEENRGVEIETSNRLQGHFGGQFGSLHQFEERMAFFELAILRQRPPGLTHQPDGRSIHRATTAGVEKWLSIPQGRPPLALGIRQAGFGRTHLNSVGKCNGNAIHNRKA